MESLRYEASMFESSYTVGEMKGKKKGLEEGKIEGKIEGKLEMAKQLKENGVPIEVIIKSSGLSNEEIQAL